MAYTIQESDTNLDSYFYSIVDSPIVQSILAILLVYTQAVYINRLVIKHKLAPEITLLPGLIYILLTSLIPAYVTLSPYLIANTIILVVIGQLFKIYKKPKVADHIFNVGFWLGVTCLFVPNYIYLIIICIFSTLILRSVKQKELAQLFGGLFTMVFILFGCLYLLDLPMQSWIDRINLYPRLSIFSFRGTELYMFIGFIILALFAVLNYNKYTIKKSIQAQKKVDILFWFLLGSGVLLFLVKDVVASNALLMFIPISVLLNTNLVRIKNPLIQELIHVVIVGLVFYLNFGML